MIVSVPDHCLSFHFSCCRFLAIGMLKLLEIFHHTGFTYLNLFGLLECLVMLLTSTLEICFFLKQGYRYHKLRKTFFFSKFYRRHYDLVSIFNVGLKSLLKQGLLEPEFYGDLVYKFRKNVG